MLRTDMLPAQRLLDPKDRLLHKQQRARHMHVTVSLESLRCQEIPYLNPQKRLPAAELLVRNESENST